MHYTVRGRGGTTQIAPRCHVGDETLERRRLDLIWNMDIRDANLSCLKTPDTGHMTPRISRRVTAVQTPQRGGGRQTVLLEEHE